MKLHTLFLSILILGFAYSGISQPNLRLGLGYYGDALSNPGFVLEIEHEKEVSDQFSLPLRADLGLFTAPDYNVLFVDLHKGFRKQFDSGLFLEQSVGVGMIATFYTLESIWYIDEIQGVSRYKKGANWGFSPSVTVGAGYQFSKDGEKQHSIWIRPKVYWNLGFRGLHLPYSAIQVGYSYYFNTKNS